MGTVPALVDGDVVISDSLAIIMVSEKHPFTFWGFTKEHFIIDLWFFFV